MNRRTIGLTVATGIGVFMFALAFVAAPHSCEWGLSTYVWCGVAALAVLVVLPFATPMSSSTLVSLGWAAGLLVLGIGVWLLGLVAANVRIICRLI